ncbi:Engulfment and cell motility protein 1 [Heterocephalus glaber]|uniref:Engulfment and cell motility protein 1 n=1 Tax=Heterocephalus glaber TaxID=10181 RepID=G5BAY4_HETGA|nr:Engulfment and cell motility protein 1 [Heterocephalus glaber]
MSHSPKATPPTKTKVEDDVARPGSLRTHALWASTEKRSPQIPTGKGNSHQRVSLKAQRREEVLELAFSILYDSNCQLNFIAPDKHEYCIWTDGLNALLGKDMMSDLTRNDLDTLLSMEIKLRLLDLENIQIPDAPPPIPKEPSNYDFVYDCN